MPAGVIQSRTLVDVAGVGELKHLGRGSQGPPPSGDGSVLADEQERVPVERTSRIGGVEDLPCRSPEPGGGITTPPDASGGVPKITLVVALVFGLT